MRSREEINKFVRDSSLGKLNIVSRAIKFAEFAHDGQVDKGGHRYFEHVGAVGREADKRYGDDNLTAIAYIHDVVEDGGFTISDLMVWFPPVIWKVVDLLTKKKSESRSVYIDRVSGNLLAAKVKIVDLDNNIDLTRIPSPKAVDYERQDRYILERAKISDAVNSMEKLVGEVNSRSSDAYYENVMDTQYKKYYGWKPEKTIPGKKETPNKEVKDERQ